MSQSIESHRRLAAIMFTDMVGYSALTQKNEALALTLLEEHKKVLRSIFSLFHGIEINVIGDAFLVEFESALRAVRCAVEIQQALRKRNDGIPELEQIRLRIGIHIGDIIHDGDAILGDGVNIAARIYPTAPPEGICISEDVARQVRNKLEMPLYKLEKQHLKNIDLPVEIYSIGLPWLPKTAGPEKKSGVRGIIPAAIRKRKIISSVSAILVLASLTSLYFYLMPSRPANANSKTIAVLPFTNMSSNPEEEYFSDGITDDILTQLCKVADLNVISRTTMMQYKGSKKTLREIAGELHAGVVLEGSVRRAGNRIRITGQLIDAPNDRHLWAETYDRELKDVFQIQSEIAQKIASALQAKLSHGEKERLARPTVSNTEVYNLLLQGRFFLSRKGHEDVAKAIDLYKQALSIDPNDARVWAASVFAYFYQANEGYTDANEGFAKARQAAEMALSLDDNLAEAHRAMGWIKRLIDWDWMGADAEYKKAITLEPGNSDIIADMSLLSATLGRFDEAVSLTRKSITLDPMKSRVYFNLGLIMMRANRLEEAADAFRKGLELNPHFPASHTYLGLIDLLQGKLESAIVEIQKEPGKGWRLFAMALEYYGAGRNIDADAALKEFIKKYQTNSAYQIAEIYAYRGDRDHAFDWLERAYVQRDGGLAALKGDPFLKNITGDPRYAPFMKKMRLPV